MRGLELILQGVGALELKLQGVRGLELKLQGVRGLEWASARAGGCGVRQVQCSGRWTHQGLGLLGLRASSEEAVDAISKGA